MTYYYVLAKLRKWEDCTVEPGLLPFGGLKGKSTGFLEVFDTLEDLYAEHPGAEYLTIREFERYHKND